MKCACGKKVQAITYKNGTKTCQYCNNTNLSGKFLRRMELERQTYARDILQVTDKEYEEVYGKPKTK